MQQNQNQYGSIDRRKAAFLIGGILVILAAVIIAVLLFTDKTKASSGSGGTVLITPERIEKISNDVSEQVLDTLRKDILAGMIKEAAAEELSKEKLMEVLADKDIASADISDEQLQEKIEAILIEHGISGDGVLSSEQKAYIKTAVERALQNALANISVTQLLTEEEKRQLEEQLRQELSAMLRNQIQNSSYQLTSQELAKIKEALNLEELIAGRVQSVTKQQVEKLQENIINQVKKSVKTPVKGIDYLTDADIKNIQNKVLKKANQETLKQIEQLTSKINEVKTSVSTLTQQVKELKLLDQQKASDIKKIQQSITQINTSMNQIQTVTKELASAIAVSGTNLEKVSGSGSEIQSVRVSASDMTIAEFVDILAGNDQVYTEAVQELNRIVKQLKEENQKQDKEFDKSLKQLEGNLDDNGREMQDVKTQMEKSSQELSDKIDEQSKEQKKQLDEQSKEQKKQLEEQSKEQKKQLDEQSKEQKEQLEEEKKAREDADSKLQSQIDKTNQVIGKEEDAGKVEGDTIFQKIGSIIKILSSDGIEGLLNALRGIGGAQTVEEGVSNLHTGLTDAGARIQELEKEKWYSNITLLAEGGEEGGTGYSCQESGSAYVYQIPLVSDEDGIDLASDDTAIVVEFKKPGRLPSNAAFSTSGNSLMITFTNKPSRNIEITSIHVYIEK